MTIDSILHFWSQHNTLIIEVLLGFVIVSSLFLAFRSFYGSKGNEEISAGTGGGVALDTAQLEKTLQKILENQSAQKPAVDFDSPAGDVMAALEADGGGSETSSAETEQLRGALTESNKKIERLQAQLAEAQAAAISSPSEAAPAESGMSSAERDELNSKLRDLEARLAEYEIISEDIADLSKFREENEELKKQIADLQAGGGSIPAPPPASEPAVTPVAEPVAESAGAVDPFDAVAESLAQQAPEPEAPAAPASEPTPEPTPVPEPAAEAAPAPAGELIDDELMKEFAAAVEGQKNLAKAEKKAGDASEEPGHAADDTDKLMNQFEDFVTKKS